ncbi:hydroxymethylglutaryl-CoA reductase, degradative [Capnocytophaga catalasegens]|uniref:3-hydroxy-3-methylglutaryl coenzyme A reductase n=1 Tax=Capnocytophaga catalasegens TaxID=1004260 RepID=A0AAV5AV64_9FLAO|nr:hydroxymethylglutaryl-CoA reductase, degradative [Capnocytophaga catalasegens]GIZ14301.1 3-hydroxy-3-methylglutaryl coenzyme A reductase [Capnocytophaga catalasegens]GJM51298.1 3-hydroxy-3-methylglutaryl coenzyme A reductase [Capnocytophaga catalasegens]GJM53285.1 3-hydroxy-3-methylglutaryl coenzyme A reductase [Capnocytophaga catalasegens]
MINGFSKFSKEQKRRWLEKNYLNDFQYEDIFGKYDNADATLQQLHDEFIENTVANYYLPLGVAPNFCINDQFYTIPMVVEESSVVAGVSKAAKYWAERGGFRSEVVSTEKIGQIHLFFDGNSDDFQNFFNQIKPILLPDTQHITSNMQKRGGGICSIELQDKTHQLTGYYQVFATFETLDAMGANFINSCLEQMAKTIEREATHWKLSGNIEILMCILSNYVPNCLVRSQVVCSIDKMNYGNISGKVFTQKLIKAVDIANIDTYRAVTHNKGVMNGIDAVIIATGNDFRAVEAALHAYACRSGQYKSLTYAYIENDLFHFGIEVPLALGTIGGLTQLHPMVKTALRILNNPNAKQLMQIVASVGLAQNFAALSALVTSGIQQGHMKMHLVNIINQLGASPEQKTKLIEYFKDRIVSYREVYEQFLTINNS